MELETVKKIVFISCPFDQLVEEYLPLVLRERVNLEIGLNGTILDRYKMPSFGKIARIIEENGLKCTIHAPFIDLSLGAIDSLVRRATVKRLLRAINIASLFKAQSMVFHTGFDPKHYHGHQEEWLENSFHTVEQLLSAAAEKKLKLNLENVFEYTTGIHQKLFSKFDDQYLGFCLDLGHQRVFSKTSMEEWLETVGARIGQLHLHDNKGEWDDHLAIGKGEIDFDGVFDFLEENEITPLLTIEAHKKEDVMPSLEGLGRILDKHPKFASRLLRTVS